MLSKVIIEAALLTDDEKVTACTLAKAAGADYVKTSTGFGPGGATAADVALMRRVVGAEMGVKAAGGVSDLDGLKAMVAAGATRVGASAGVKIVQQARGIARAREDRRRPATEQSAIAQARRRPIIPVQCSRAESSRPLTFAYVIRHWRGGPLRVGRPRHPRNQPWRCRSGAAPRGRC